MLLAVTLPVMAQQVEVTSLKRLLENREVAAYCPVLNPSGDRLVYQTDNSGMKMYDLTSDKLTTITTDYVVGIDVCWGGDGKVYFVSSDMDENNLIYRTGCSYDVVTGQMARLTEPQHAAVHAVPATLSHLPSRFAS